MREFYLYYEIVDGEGKIKSIAPSKLDEFSELECLVLPWEVAKPFIEGRELPTNWCVKKHPKKGPQLEKLTRMTEMTYHKFELMKNVSMLEDDPEIAIVYHRERSVFDVEITDHDIVTSYFDPQLTLYFFVTRKDDPHVLYFEFTVKVRELQSKHKMVIECPVTLPDKFSVFTKKVFDRYLFEVMK